VEEASSLAIISGSTDEGVTNLYSLYEDISYSQLEKPCFKLQKLNKDKRNAQVLLLYTHPPTHTPIVQ
jgi:hypothetical protein